MLSTAALNVRLLSPGREERPNGHMIIVNRSVEKSCKIDLNLLMKLRFSLFEMSCSELNIFAFILCNESHTRLLQLGKICLNIKLLYKEVM